MTNKNDEMAGIVSEPAGNAPEVKPAKSLWPRPYGAVRIEPTLDPPRIEDVRAPEVSLPREDFETVPAEGHQQAEPAIFAAREPEAAPIEPSFSEDAAQAPVQEEMPFEEPAAEVPRGPEPEIEEPAVAEAAPVADEVREEPPEPRVEPEPELEPELRAEPALAAAPEIVAEPLRASEEERAFEPAAEPAVHEAARENRGARFVAMAAGIVVALALGAVAFMYGASALGFKLGGEETAEAPPAVEASAAVADAGESAPEPQDAQNDQAAAPAGTDGQNTASAEDQLKAAQDRIAELEAQVARLESAQDEPAPRNEPAQGSQDAAEPAPTPAQDGNSSSSSESTPAASANSTAPSEPAQAEPTPAETARAPEPAPPTPPAVPKPRPETADRAPARPATETARAEPGVLVPPPGADPRPSYNEPPRGGSPDMPVLQNWSVRDVYNGIAVVQGYRGPLMEVEPGDELPGGNRVLAIRRLGGNWAVVTERGIISAR